MRCFWRIFEKLRIGCKFRSVMCADRRGGNDGSVRDRRDGFSSGLISRSAGPSITFCGRWMRVWICPSWVAAGAGTGGYIPTIDAVGFSVLPLLHGRRMPDEDRRQAVIVDVEATPARTYDEVAATTTMIERTEQRLDLKPDRLAADTAYGTGKFLGWLVGVGITPHIPVWQRPDGEDGTLSCFDFVFDATSNTVTCPSGKRLQQYRRNFKQERTGVTKANTRIYRASRADCRHCPLKSKCCPNVSARKIVRDVNEAARDYARSLKDTPEFDNSRDERKRVEMRFAHLKTHHRFERMRLRGLSGARDEFHLAAFKTSRRSQATSGVRRRTCPPAGREGQSSRQAPRFALGTAKAVER
jgi:hypothetical protein